MFMHISKKTFSLFIFALILPTISVGMNQKPQLPQEQSKECLLKFLEHFHGIQYFTNKMLAISLPELDKAKSSEIAKIQQMRFKRRHDPKDSCPLQRRRRALSDSGRLQAADAFIKKTPQ